MSKKNKKKLQKNSSNSTNSRKDLHKMGKNNIYIILGMVIIGLAIAIYRVSVTN